VSAAAVSWQDARRLAHGAGARLSAEWVVLDDAVGRVLADDLVAQIPVPHYASSAMDGWAVAGEGPWRILSSESDPGGSLGDEEDAGAGRSDAPGFILRAGEALPIVTGAVIPPGTRGVLRSEHGVAVLAAGDDGSGALLSMRPGSDGGEPGDGLHIRPAGTEAAAGETVFRAGTVLTPAHVAVAAGCGHDEVAVVRRPRVTLVLTGGEVVERGIPGPGSVRDSFGPVLPAVLAGLGADVVARHRIGDDFAATVDLFTTSSAPDLIVTTGGTGDSPADHVRPGLRAVGAEFLVDGIAVRPGAPALLARLPDGRLVIGLPGNPLAAILALLTLAHPLVSAMEGGGMPVLGHVRIAAALPAGKAPTTLRPYRLVAGEAHPTAWHGAGMLRGLAESDGVLVVPREGAAAGAELQVLPLPW
jgi:molybdopterin molybdotransferase